MDKVYPLSLLAFVATSHALSIPRQPQKYREDTEEEVRASGGPVSQVAGLDHVFRRHVKPKKQHEIKNLAEVRKIYTCAYVY